MSGEDLICSQPRKVIGIIVLVIAQFHNGVIHTVSGLGLLFAPNNGILAVPSPILGVVFCFYTLIYGLLSLFFASGLLLGKRWGWIGTALISMFVVFSFSAMVIWNNLRSFPDLTGVFDITYSIIISAYLFQPHVRRMFSKK